MTRTIKGFICKMAHRRPSNCNFAVPRVLYEYSRRGLVPRFSSSQLS